MCNPDLKEFDIGEVSKHTSEDDCWLVIGNDSNGRFSCPCGNFHFGSIHDGSFLDDVPLVTNVDAQFGFT